MDTIKIGEKNRPVKFGVWAVKEFAKLKDVTMDVALKGFDSLSTEDIVKLVYCGFLYGAKAEKEEVDFDEDDVWMWMDDNENVAQQVMQIFSNSSPQSKNVKAPIAGQP